MKSITSKWKIWLIITLAVVAVGMILLGVLGLNDSVDYSNSYEVQIDIDQDLDGASDKIYKSAQAYFERKGAEEKVYATQKNANGGYIFKFDVDPGFDADDLAEKVTADLNNANVKVTAAVKEVVTDANFDVLGVSLILGISAVVIFLFILIKDKLKASLAVLASSVASVLLSLALVAITRVPAMPFLPLSLCGALLFGSVISSGMVARFNEEKKNAANSGLSDKEIADKGAYNSILRILCLVIVFLVFTLVLDLVNIGYLSFVAIHVLIAGISSAFASLFITPVIWSAVKNNKKN